MGCITLRPNLQCTSSQRSYPENRLFPRFFLQATMCFPQLVERFPGAAIHCSYPLPPNPRGLLFTLTDVSSLPLTPAATFWNKTKELRFPYWEIRSLWRNSNPHPGIHQRHNIPWLSGESNVGTRAPFHNQDKTKTGSMINNLHLSVYGQKALRTFLSASLELRKAQI